MVIIFKNQELFKNNIDVLFSVLEEEKQEFLYDLNLVLNNREIEE
ncbi:hypothetical protein ACWIUH_12210 [Ursidibacter arcticus]